MARRGSLWLLLVLVSIAPALVTTGWAAKFSEARIYIEFNDSANDLGFHVSIDGPNWRSLSIVNPDGITVFEVTGRAGYHDLGMTELFFEGAEPSLDDVPLGELLALFPEGRYRMVGETVAGTRIASTAVLSHAVPDGPPVFAVVLDDGVIIRWDPVTAPPEGFPDRAIDIVGYQVIVESFQVTLPASSREVTVPREFVESLGHGEHPFEVLAIDAGGAQSITEGTFAID